MHALRFPFAAGSGLFVTLAVFTLLWTFVSRPIDVGRQLTSTDIRFTRQIIDTETEVKRQRKTTREPPVVVPDDPHIVIDRGGGTDPARFQRTKIDIDIGRRGNGLTIGQDREPTPVVRPPPEYPASAITRGIEGWVQLQFSVTAIGTVRDAVVVDSSPQGSFEDAALKAIARWRYNPKVEGGVAVERVGLQTVIRFELQ